MKTRELALGKHWAALLAFRARKLRHHRVGHELPGAGPKWASYPLFPVGSTVAQEIELKLAVDPHDE